MKYPDFFDALPTITLRDELADFLGTFKDAKVEFSYKDVVKASGHSCPTIAGAYIMTLVALKELYKDEIPTRGEIQVAFREEEKSGVIGVMANVIMQITGATNERGFKGLNGRFARDKLMKFGVEMSPEIEFMRLDTKQKVGVSYNPSCINPHPKLQNLMSKMVQNIVTDDEKIEFGKLWQDRVKRIFENIDGVVVVERIFD